MSPPGRAAVVLRSVLEGVVLNTDVGQLPVFIKGLYDDAYGNHAVRSALVQDFRAALDGVRAHAARATWVAVQGDGHCMVSAILASLSSGDMPRQLLKKACAWATQVVDGKVAMGLDLSSLPTVRASLNRSLESAGVSPAAFKAGCAQLLSGTVSDRAVPDVVFDAILAGIEYVHGCRVVIWELNDRHQLVGCERPFERAGFAAHKERGLQTAHILNYPKLKHFDGLRFDGRLELPAVRCVKPRDAMPDAGAGRSAPLPAVSTLSAVPPWRASRTSTRIRDLGVGAPPGVPLPRDSLRGTGGGGGQGAAAARARSASVIGPAAHPEGDDAAGSGADCDDSSEEVSGDVPFHHKLLVCTRCGNLHVRDHKAFICQEAQRVTVLDLAVAIETRLSQLSGDTLAASVCTFQEWYRGTHPRGTAWRNEPITAPLVCIVQALFPGTGDSLP